MLGGGIYGSLVDERPLRGFLHGALNGALICLAIAPFEIWLLRGARLLREAPFLALIAAKSVYYLAVFALSGVAADLVVQGIAPVPASGPVRGFSTHDFIFAGAMSVGVNFILAINRLLGQSVLWDFVTGRYHRPRQEERIFLMLDMVDSTGIAERIGDVAFHRLLHRFFSDLGLVMIEHKGAVHKYVGDEMIVTWRREAGIREARCIRAALAAARRLEREGDEYERRFGVRPRFRAALHAGSVVSGEMGDLKKEIVFLGDALNTAARIEQACRDTGQDLLVSAALLSQVTLPAGIRAESLGPVTLRGKEVPVELFSLRPA